MALDRCVQEFLREKGADLAQVEEVSTGRLFHDYLMPHILGLVPRIPSGTVETEGVTITVEMDETGEISRYFMPSTDYNEPVREDRRVEVDNDPNAQRGFLIANGPYVNVSVMDSSQGRDDFYQDRQLVIYRGEDHKIVVWGKEEIANIPSLSPSSVFQTVFKRSDQGRLRGRVLGDHVTLTFGEDRNNDVSDIDFWLPESTTFFYAPLVPAHVHQA